MNLRFQLATKEFVSEILDMMSEFNAIDNYPFDRELNKQNLKELISNAALGGLWLIYVDDKLAGYIVLAFGFSFEYKGRDAFIDELFVKEDFRNKGIGSKTMEFIEKKAKELHVKVLHLEVEGHNDIGNKLYIKRGYKNNGRFLLTKNI